VTQQESLWIIKARLSCVYLKNDDLRLIFSYFSEERRVDFIEIYYKGDKENHDQSLIDSYLNEQKEYM